MLASERRTRILQELERLGTVRVSHLVRILEVSDMTVRRDLDMLRRQGLLEKVHGGARRKTRSADEPGSAPRSGRRLPEQEAIAARAAAMVEAGSAVALTAGSTTHALARHLAGIPRLTVVTNWVWVADALRGDDTDVTVLLTGGIRTPTDALVGPIAVKALRALHVDVTFLGVHGMTARTGFTSSNVMEAETNRAMVASGRRLVVVADSAKWGVLGLASVAPLSRAALLVTDTGLPAEAREVLAEQGTDVVLVEPAPAGTVPPTTPAHTG